MNAVIMPHDRAIKLALSDVRVARDLFNYYLPEKIKEIVNLENLFLQSGSFVDKELKSSCTDLLYHVELNNQDSTSGYLYLLVEAQRNPDKWMAFRLLKYIVRILEQYQRQHPNENELPLVVPLVLYVGEGIYPFSLEVKTLFGKHANYAAENLLGPYPHVDLQVIPDEDICQHSWSGLLELVLKQAKKRDAIQLLETLIVNFLEPLKMEPHADIYIEGMLNYLIDQADIVNVPKFFEHLQNHLPPTKEETIMSIAERLRQEGLARGIMQGMQQGMQQGMHQGIEQGVEQARINLAKKMLAKGYDEQLVQELSELSLERIKHLKGESKETC